MIKVLMLILSLSVFPTKKDVTEIYKVIKFVETNDDPTAVGDNGRAFGVVQIHKSCIDDVNKTFKTNFTHQDAFDECKAKQIFYLYISKGIRLFKKKYNKNPTEMDIVRMWNGGCYKGYLYKSTLKYWRRYLSYKRKLNKLKIN